MKALRAHNYFARMTAANSLPLIQAEERVKVRDYFSGSDTHTCGRKHWYKRMGVRSSNPFTPDVKDKLDKGHLLEEHLLGRVLPGVAGVVVSFRQEQVDAVFDFAYTPPGTSQGLVPVVPGGLPVRILGFLDGVVEVGGKHFILECKTTSEWGYKSSVKALLEGDRSHYSFGYFKQANRYAFAWNATKPSPMYPRISGVVLLVYNVNGSKDQETGLPWRDFWFELDQTVLEEDIAYLSGVERSIQDGKKPERGYTDLGWDCAGCSWFHLCWPKGERKSSDPKVAAKVRELEAGSGDDPSGSVGQGTPAAGRKRGRVLEAPPAQGRTQPEGAGDPGQAADGGQGSEVPAAGADPGNHRLGGAGRGPHRRKVDATRGQPRGGSRRTPTAGAKRKSH